MGSDIAIVLVRSATSAIVRVHVVVVGTPVAANALAVFMVIGIVREMGSDAATATIGTASAIIAFKCACERLPWFW